MPDGDQPAYYELTPTEYEERFNSRWNINNQFNVLGYGKLNGFVPPLFQPEWLLSEFDRFQLTITSIPIAPFMQENFFLALGSRDAWNGFWYNNAQAAGMQLYPDGMSKYYDMYSFTGLTSYWLYYGWYLICATFTPLTIIPMNFWFGMLNGDSWDEIWKVIVPGPLAWFFHIRGEKGWVLN